MEHTYIRYKDKILQYTASSHHCQGGEAKKITKKSQGELQFEFFDVYFYCDGGGERSTDRSKTTGGKTWIKKKKNVNCHYET